MRHPPLSIIFALLLLLAITITPNLSSAEDCIIPESGPWPPCATGGSGTPANPPPASDDCVIPETGPWPPCATGSVSGGNPPPSTGAGQPCPPTGKWPPGCIPNGGEADTPTTQESGWVTKIVDGDTFELNINGGAYSLRMIGIDTPERGEPCANEATDYLRQLINGKSVQLEKDISETDQYTRLLRYVYESDRFVNGEMVHAGLAYAKDYPPDTKYSDKLHRLEAEARNAKRGCLWNGTISAEPVDPNPAPSPQPPPDQGGSCSASASACTCSHNAYNCSDFSTQCEAQACYEKCRAEGRGDVHKLDRDNDGRACESLPLSNAVRAMLLFGK